MKIAIIGGGASGIVASYLLAGRHDIHLFERASYLGGNVRTLGGNVPCDALPPGTRLETGVLAFSIGMYPKFYQLLRQLQIAGLS